MSNDQKILPKEPDTRQRMGIILGAVSLVMLGIGVFILKAGEFESGVRISSQTATGEAGVTGLIWVDVEGEVTNPGVYKLNRRSRIDDAITAAGGLTAEADVTWVEKNVNRAQILTDGVKIYIPNKQTSISFQDASDADVKIKINSATQKELEKALPGIGPVTAEKIINGRPFNRIEELTERKIISVRVWGRY